MIGWNEKYLYFIVVDGRQSFSIGMTYPEMAALVKEYDCTEAVELDGGGSSTLGHGQDPEFSIRWPATGNCQRADLVRKTGPT